MTVWQIVTAAAVLLVFLIVAYQAGRNIGESSARITQMVNRETDWRSEPFFKAAYYKMEKTSECWKIAHDSLLLEVQRLNKAILKRNRRIAALKRAAATSSESQS